MLRRPRRQPLLLDRYWNALRTDAATTPPDGLDPDLQAQTARLADSARQLDASSRFALRLRSHLQAQPVNCQQRSFSRAELPFLVRQGTESRFNGKIR